MEKMGKKAKIASQNLYNLNLKKRNSVLKLYCQYLKKYSKSILKANKRDLIQSKYKIKNSMIDRLKLNEKKNSINSKFSKKNYKL